MKLVGSHFLNLYLLVVGSLWVAHLFLPTLQTGRPGWVQIYFIFNPAGVLLLLPGHILFIILVFLLSARIWEGAAIIATLLLAVATLVQPGPWLAPGVLCLYAAYLLSILAAFVGAVRNAMQNRVKHHENR